MKKLIALLLVLVCVGCTSNTEPTPQTTPDPANEQTPAANLPCDALDPCDETADMSGYEQLADSKHVFVSTSYGDVLKFIENKESAVIYMGHTDCPWCLEAAPILNEVAKEFNQTVYYVNTRAEQNQSEEGKASRGELVVFMQAVLNENDQGEKALFVPDVLFLKEGEIMANHISTVDSHNAHERLMNEEEVLELKQIYSNFFTQFLAE